MREWSSDLKEGYFFNGKSEKIVYSKNINYDKDAEIEKLKAEISELSYKLRIKESVSFIKETIEEKIDKMNKIVVGDKEVLIITVNINNNAELVTAGQQILKELKFLKKHIILTNKKFDFKKLSSANLAKLGLRIATPVVKLNFED